MTKEEALDKIVSFKEALPAASREIDEIIETLSIYDKKTLLITREEKDALIDALNTKKHYTGFKIHNIENTKRYKRDLTEEFKVMLHREQTGVIKRNKILYMLIEKIKEIEVINS